MLQCTFEPAPRTLLLPRYHLHCDCVMSVALHVGDRIRPWGGLNFGTAGFFCVDTLGVTFVATCDHVIKTLSTPENEPSNVYFPLEHSYTNKVAVYEGRSLVSPTIRVADFALARVLIETGATAQLPVPIPATDVQQFHALSEPRSSQEVLLWGAKTASYHSGVVLHKTSEHAWPHGKYGIVQYEKQFSVAITSAYIPDIGDSGGYVVTADGLLVGLIAALSGTVTEAGNSLIHCVPVQECCSQLGVSLLTKGS